MKKLLKIFLAFMLVFVLSFSNVKAQDQQEGDPQVVPVLVETAPVVKIKGNNNSLILTWNAVTNAQSYVIERSTNSKKGFKKIATVTTNTYTDKKLTYGTKYYYKVTAKGAENSKKSEVVSKKVVPNKVTNVVLKPGSTNIKVSWDKTKNSGYYVYSSTDGKKWTRVKTITKNTTLTFNNKKLKSNKIYYYQVQAYQKVGTKIVTGSKSAIVSIRTAPAAPTTKFISESIENIIIKIKKTKGAKKYQIYQYSNDTKKYELEYSIDAEWFYDEDYYQAYFYVDKPYTTLKFKVRACSSTVCGSYTEVSGQAKLGKPDIYSLRGEKTAATLMYESVYGAEGYEIYRATSKSGKYTKIKTLKGQDNTVFKNTKLTSGKTYYYKVRSYAKLNGKMRYSSYSGIRSVKIGSGAGVNSAMEDAKKLNKEWYYSKKGLITILVEYFGYSESDAKKGVEKCNIDYKSNALKLAKEIVYYYYGISESGMRSILAEYFYTQKEIDYAMSKININWHKALVDAITEDMEYGYSESQYLANYAEETYGYTQAEVLAVLEELNIDYNVQALNRLNTYINWSNNLSEDEARSYLENCGFTTDQINYAIANTTYDWLSYLEEVISDYLEYVAQNDNSSKLALIENIADYIETYNYPTYSSDDIAEVLDRFEINFNVRAANRAYDLVEYEDYSKTEVAEALEDIYLFTASEIEYAINYVDTNCNFDIIAGNRLYEYLIAKHNTNHGVNETELTNYLTNAGFTQSNIEAAIENYNIDFVDEALIDAQSMIYNDSISKQALIEALVELGFSEEVATSAASNTSFDYNEECADFYAVNYQYSSYTPAEIRALLKDTYKFTDANIDYAFETYNVVED